ncbi:hypothetical protein Mgra_00006574, partial [Meloidogyne graminicola]
YTEFALPPPSGAGNFSPSSSSPLSNSPSPSSPTKPINEIKFSLVELSFLINLLKQINYNYLINNSYMYSFHQVILMNADMFLDNSNQKNLKEDPLILSTLGKITEVI